jgi:hypothetical protein
MTAQTASGFSPAGDPHPGFEEHGLPRPLRYRSGVSASLSMPPQATGGAEWLSTLKGVTGRLSRAPESILVAIIGFGAAVYIGLYLGVVPGVNAILRDSFAELVPPVDLLEGLIRILAGWVIFLFIGLLTSMYVRHRMSKGELPRSPALPQNPDKEHVLGYD